MHNNGFVDIGPIWLCFKIVNFCCTEAGLESKRWRQIELSYTVGRRWKRQNSFWSTHSITNKAVYGGRHAAYNENLLWSFTFDRTIKHPVGDENSNLGASKSLDLGIQPGNSQNHLFHGILCYALDATKFRPKFRLRPKTVLCFRFLLHRNRKHRNWFRFPFKGKGISAERKISAENFGFLCSLGASPPLKNLASSSLWHGFDLAHSTWILSVALPA